ncbi:MAG: DNA polymerase I [Lachnospiraceae bacterium]|nr:DNA polymerase I [Lachnospiraceae bacterium]
MPEKIVAIDGHSILNRAFYGVPALTNSAGVPTNAVFGFMNILMKILEEEKLQYLAVAFDRKEPTFRHKMFDGYKGTRKPMPEELHAQVPLMKELLTACGVPIFELPGYEADDILGTISRKSEAAGMEVTLVSGDRDLLQLATEHTCIRIPKTKAGGTVTENYHAADVKERYQVTPEEFVDVKALMGDASDNIPGVPSIGEKTATALIATWHSLEQIREHLDEVKPPRAQKALREHFDLAELSRTLAKICVEAPIDLEFEKAQFTGIATPEGYEVLSRLELKSLMKRFETEIPQQEAAEEKLTEIREISGIAEAEDVLSAIPQGSTVGFASWYPEEENAGKKAEASVPAGFDLALAGGDVIFRFVQGGFLTKAWLEELIGRIAGRTGTLCVSDLKAERKFWDLPEHSRFTDAGVASYLLNPLKSTYDLGDIARDHLGETLPENRYGEAARVLAEAADPLQEKLKKEGMEQLFREVEMPLIDSLDRMEKAGIRVEREALAEYGQNLVDGIRKDEEGIYELAGHAFNILSPKQLGQVLFEEMKLPFAKKTKTGYSTNAGVLEKLKTVHPIAALVLDYRTLAKLKSTYAEGLQPFIQEDGRIHGRFNQTVTATGRISSADPNLQNIPVRMELGRAIRKVFVPEPGCIFVDADYSQIELRVLAHMSGDEKLIEAYRQDQDIHRVTASQVFHVPFEEVTPELRRNAKAVNFGIVYGISAFGLSEDLSISRKEATEYIERYFATYPGVKAYLDGLVRQGKEEGIVRTMYGRIRPIPELKSSNFMQRQFGERVAMNSPIQGTAADIMKIAMIRVDEALRREGLKSRIVLQVHDELILETPEEESAAAAALLEREMRNAAELAVPLEVAVSTGHSWYETK